MPVYILRKGSDEEIPFGTMTRKPIKYSINPTTPHHTTHTTHTHTGSWIKGSGSCLLRACLSQHLLLNTFSFLVAHLVRIPFALLRFWLCMRAAFLARLRCLLSWLTLVIRWLLWLFDLPVMFADHDPYRSVWFDSSHGWTTYRHYSPLQF